MQPRSKKANVCKEPCETRAKSNGKTITDFTMRYRALTKTNELNLITLCKTEENNGLHMKSMQAMEN